MDRVDPLKERIPADATVGYLSSDEGWGERGHRIARGVTRYTLLPRVIERTDEWPLVIAHFQTEAFLQEAVKSGPYRLIERVSPGLALLENTEVSDPSVRR